MKDTHELPVSISLTTNGVGGTFSLSRPSATVSFKTIRLPVRADCRITKGRITLTTTGALPLGLRRTARKAMDIPPAPMRFVRR